MSSPCPDSQLQPWIQSGSREPFTLNNAFRCIQLKKVYRHTASCCFGNYEQPTQFKVLRPNMLAWMKKRGDFLRLRIDGRKIGSFELIACDARESEIVLGCATSVLLRDDMIYLMSMKAEFGWSQTIFASRPGSLLHSPTHFRRDMHLAHDAINLVRALALATRTRCSTRMICPHSSCSPSFSPSSPFFSSKAAVRSASS